MTKEGIRYYAVIQDKKRNGERVTINIGPFQSIRHFRSYLTDSVIYGNCEFVDHIGGLVELRRIADNGISEQYAIVKARDTVYKFVRPVVDADIWLSIHPRRQR